MDNTTTYSVETLRSRQPRPYADTEREYRITIKKPTYDKEGPQPWLLYGDVEAQIKRDEAARAAGTMMGGRSPDDTRKAQLEWAKGIVRALCQNFREKDDDDGRVDMHAYFFPTLKWLKLDPKAGTIHVFIIEPYTD